VVTVSDIDIETILEALPDDIEASDIALVCGAIIAGFSADSREAHGIIRDLIAQLAVHYSDEPCTCAECTAERKKGMN
jgi:hypothetical protein